jgi:hypothetical protein
MQPSDRECDMAGIYLSQRHFMKQRWKMETVIIAHQRDFHVLVSIKE